VCARMETRAIKGSPINADQYVVEDEAGTATLGRSPAIAGVGALVALGGMFIMAGCSDHSGRPGIVSTKTVLNHFQISTGQSLVVSRRQRAKGLFKTELDELTLANPDPALGDFKITVYLNPDVAQRERFLEGGPIARTRIHWGRYRPEYTTEEGFWVATRIYGNVMLDWRSNVRKTNDQWNRLDGALRTLPGLEPAS